MLIVEAFVSIIGGTTVTTTAPTHGLLASPEVVLVHVPHISAAEHA
jgi:hypothetical protein